jgi:hypothetical protein
MEEPRWPLPEVPELEDSRRSFVAGPYEWTSDASRQLENFTDFAHFPWLHPGLFGDPERVIVPNYEVKAAGNLLSYEIVRPGTADVGLVVLAALPFESGAEDVFGRLVGVELLDQIFVASRDSTLTDRAFFSEFAGIDGKRPGKECQPEHAL